MPVRESEAFVLRTYPFHEADLIVSFFTRDMGKLRGVAKGVRKLKSPYGAALERLAHVRVSYFYRPNVELARIERSELVGAPLVTLADYPAHIALDYVAEIAEEMLPEHEANDAYFRLLALVVEETWQGLSRAPRNGADGLPGALWRNLTYFALWAVKLGGWLPPLDVCLETGVAFEPEETAWFERAHCGLLSAEVKSGDSWALSPASRRLAAEMLRKKLDAFPPDAWSGSTARDLRRFLDQRLEDHLDRRLRSLRLLEAL